MRKSIAILCGAALIGMTGQAVAQSTMKEDKPMAKPAAAQKPGRFATMDTNNDGMVSRDEFMKYHEGMWTKMKRNDKDMAMMYDVEGMYGLTGTAIPGEPKKKARP